MINIEIGFRTYDIDYYCSSAGNTLIIRIDNITENFDLSELEEGEYYVRDCLLLPYIPVEIIRVNSDGSIYVFAFFDDWYKTDPEQLPRAQQLFVKR